MDRARKGGADVLIVTVDSQIEGTRYRDIHNGLGVPPKLTPGNVWSVVSHPSWAVGMLRSPHYTFGNMIQESQTGGLDDLATWVKGALRPAIDEGFLKTIRARWSGGLVIKGILSEADARIAVAAGADAIVVSNHGGRALEGALSTIEIFPRIHDVVPDKIELYADSGIRTGIDVVRFLGFGARACLIGRAYAYGLGADGERGVTKALDIISDEASRVLSMIGLAKSHACRRTLSRVRLLFVRTTY